MAKKLLIKLSKNQVARFVLSAGVGFLVDISLFYILYRHVLIKPVYHIVGRPFSNKAISFTISYLSGVLTNFFITRYIVFTESTLEPYKQFVRFVSVAIVGYFANLGLLELFTNSLNIDPPVARPMAMLSLFFASFFIHKFFSFSLSLRHHAVGTNNKSGN